MVLFSVSNKLCDYFMMPNSPNLHFIDIMWYFGTFWLNIWLFPTPPHPQVTLYILLYPLDWLFFQEMPSVSILNVFLWWSFIVILSKFTIYWNNLDISAHFWSKFWYLTPPGISLYGYTLQICPLCLINVIVLCLK